MQIGDLHSTKLIEIKKKKTFHVLNDKEYDLFLSQKLLYVYVSFLDSEIIIYMGKFPKMDFLTDVPFVLV